MGSKHNQGGSHASGDRIDPHKASHTAVAIKRESDYPWSTPSGAQRWCGETELASSASPPAHWTGAAGSRPPCYLSRGR